MAVEPLAAPVVSVSEPRTDKLLIDATRPFAVENRAASWWYLVSTMAILALFTAVAALAPWSPLRAVSSLLAGLVVVRGFILYHDAMHGALLRNSRVARALFYVYGVLVLNPPNVWRQTHNYHHAHTAKIVGSHVGSYAMLTTDMWAKTPRLYRALYKITRHPITILSGYLTIFLYGMCAASFLRNPRKNWDSLVALVVHGGLLFVLWHFYGPAMAAFTLVIPLTVACAAGGYLFYAQHNFPDIHVQPRETWSYTRAALESSSYMVTGPIMGWFTGNIGYHHVHHLNPSIPFYRLPEAMAAIPELQNPGVTSLSPSDIVACFRLKLWDPAQQRMVGYPT